MRERLKYHREDGVTLIELLAVITLLAIITTVIYSVAFQGFKSEKTTSDTLLLNQEVNIFVSDLRAQYYDKDKKNEGKLCSELNPSLEITNAKIINGEAFFEDGCIKDVNQGEQLELSLTFANKEGKGREITIETVWDNASSGQGNIVLTDDDPNPDPETDEGYRDGELPCLDNPDFKKGNITWNGDKENIEGNCQRHTGGFPNRHGTLEGNLTITEQAKLNGKIDVFVGGNITAEEQLEVRGSSKLEVKGIAIFKKQFDVMGRSIVKLGPNVEAKDLTVKGSTLKATGAFKVDGQFDVENGSTVDIGGDVHVVRQFNVNNSTVNIGYGLTVDGQLEVDGSRLVTGGPYTRKPNVIVKGQFDVKRGSLVTIDSGLTTKDLNVEGSELEVKGTATVHVKGQFDVLEGKYKDQFDVKKGSYVRIVPNLKVNSQLTVDGSSTLIVVGTVNGDKSSWN